ncbi:MAG: integrase core domain-containing protein [Campylobacterota bacterium]|nr:integrase core domain-containing protein [Campylobacterota bacterium]
MLSFRNKKVILSGSTYGVHYIERFWRSIKYEEIYLNEYKNMKVLNRAIEKYMNSYNSKRLHSAIDYKTPNEVYYDYINNLDFQGGKLLQSVS